MLSSIRNASHETQLKVYRQGERNRNSPSAISDSSSSHQRQQQKASATVAAGISDISFQQGQKAESPLHHDERRYSFVSRLSYPIRDYHDVHDLRVHVNNGITCGIRA